MMKLWQAIHEINSIKFPMLSDYCINGDYKGSLAYRSKKFSCRELVKYNPTLCEDKDLKNNCCQSCGNFTWIVIRVDALLALISRDVLIEIVFLRKQNNINK